MIQLVVVLFVLSACEPRVFASGPARERCDTFGLEVVDAETSAPVTKFTVALTRESSDPFRPQFAVPFGYPLPPGELVESIPVLSDAGRYCFEERPAGDLTIVVGSAEHVFATIRNWSDDGVRLVRLQKAPRLDGRVADSSGNPVEGAEIRIMRRGESPSDPPRATTDAGGTFSVKTLHLPPGIEQFEVDVRHPAFHGTRRVVRRDGLSSLVEISLGDRVTGGPLAGTPEGPAALRSDLALSLALQNPFPVSVLVNGKPAASIQLVPLDPNNETTFASHGVLGQRIVRGLRKGRYDLLVNHLFKATVEVPAPFTADIETHSLTLLLDGGDDELADPRIELSRTSAPGELGYARPPRLIHRGGGEWWAESLLPGEHEIVITAPGFKTERLSVVVPRLEVPRVSLDALRPPAAEPSSALPARERTVLQHVLRDVGRRVTAAFGESDDPPVIRLLSQTDATQPVDAAGLRFEDDPESSGLDGLLGRFEFGENLPAIEVGPLLMECGLAPVALADLPIDRTRLGRVATTLDLVDEGRLNENGPPFTVLLSVTRPVFSSSGGDALVFISSRQVDLFNWVYLVRFVGAEVEIQRVLEPKPSC